MVRGAGGHRPHNGDLARVSGGLPRTLSVRHLDHSRRYVRPRGHAVSELRREARPPMRALLRAYHGAARHARMAFGGIARARGARRTGDGVLRPALAAALPPAAERPV